MSNRPVDISTGVLVIGAGAFVSLTPRGEGFGVLVSPGPAGRSCVACVRAGHTDDTGPRHRAEKQSPRRAASCPSPPSAGGILLGACAIGHDNANANDDAHGIIGEEA